jgi:hypothetical protein
MTRNVENLAEELAAKVYIYNMLINMQNQCEDGWLKLGRKSYQKISHKVKNIE